MKTKWMHTAGTLCLSVILFSSAASARAGGVPPVELKTTSGTVGAVDARDKVLKLDGFLFPKTFVLGDNCTLWLADRKADSLADFQPGLQVTVDYRNVQGVLVASQIAEKKLS